MVARSSSISRVCAGVSRGRYEGGFMETPELPGPLLREGKGELGSVSNARFRRPGSSTDKSKYSSIPSPSPHAPACPMASGPQLLHPRGARASSVLSSRVSVTSYRVRTLGWGPKAVVEQWVPCALAALPAQHLSKLLSEGLPHNHGR